MKIHIVKKGDTLYMIAQKYNVSLEEILKLNPSISNPDEIDIGMKIKVPAGHGGDMEIMHQHVVQQGDTLWKLSKAWGVPLGDMIKANPQLKNPNVLLTGEVVNIPKPGMPSTMPEMHDTESGHHKSGTGHHPLHPASVMHGVQGLMGKIPTVKIPTGKKPTGPKADTTPMPMPEPVPTPMPVPTEVPIAEKKYPVHKPYEQSVDLFKQYGIPATEVMSLHDMQAAPVSSAPIHSGYGYSQPTSVAPASTGGYGYHQPTMVSPAMTGGYGYEQPSMVSPAMTGGYGYGQPTMVSPAMTGGYGYGQPTMVSPAMTGGYGYEQPTMVSPAMTGGYGYEQPTMVSPAMTGGYGYEQPTMVSPAMTGGYGYEQPTAVSPAAASPEGGAGLPWGAPNYGWGSPMVSPASDENSGPGFVSPENMGPMGGYGYGGYNPSMVSPENTGPMGGYGYGGYNPSMVSPENTGPMGGYGYGGYNPSMVSPANMGPQYTYGYAGNGQVSPVNTTGKKPCNCGCHEKREEEDFEVESEPVKVSKSAAGRKPAKKAVIRQARTLKPKRRDSLPWINR
ncbi:LysM peptidoglycan-binding domain-containing protein [Paenibacillus sacheonensis]|uniref:LysM peptidoglycan-binding domain-containing protein n=1 Tax=Paenibacillus sacheonensis TaxID=742054 RepID=A0A7X4YM30_9BACL|nr:morphogenetic protein associated with SpoVID [Paenibacillus sacheonensis]NBC67889.1 LysM peptidoglycan-binding domain-containing protein [Paenibacillus sacheonensis]